ncbi:insulinase family protein [Paraglaciecola aquimarina]|uniref:Insulinase family protein n=1 Tax=Paraglaciecola aquimarina TaxID=1235557 RepID=A0ABU3SUL9_9ALTE|nr:insulinase family protein [Paraglaciecola aquimarina]MDU0353652.1 insulinase family protein [Paraglaciecola aquimarina]
MIQKTSPKTLLQRLTPVLALLLFSITFGACQSNDLTSKPQTANTSGSANAFSGKLPITSRIVKGQLDNGIGYIIQKNTKPAKRAEIRLVVNIGSLAEDESQLGFAHFTEHMAFNGTEDFKKQQIVEYVESIGMKFGAHLNAHTSFDETVYKLQIPTDNQDTIETGFHILENWAHKISFEPEEIDKERGVVIEELRSRKGANERIFNKQLPVLFKGSRYAERLPIGKQHILEQGKHQDLIRFYKDWYRPDLMSVVVVGDLEPANALQLINKYFAKIEPTKTQNTKQDYALPENAEPLISIETDPELTRTTASLTFKQDLLEIKAYADLKQKIAHSLFTGMLNNRIREAVLKPESPIVAGGSDFSALFANNSAFNLRALVKPNQSKAAIKFLLSEYNRILQHGFTATELARQKASILRAAEKGAIEIDKTPSSRLASQYVSYFTKNTALLDSEQYNTAYQHFIPRITLQDVNQLASQWWHQENRLVSISAPEKTAASLPTTQQLLTLWQQSTQRILQPYQDEEVANSLMPLAPKPGSVVSKKYDESLDAHLWTLSNGARVILKKTDFKEDEILFSASSEGGNSLQATDEYLTTLLSTQIVNAMGIGQMNAVQLGKFMKGKQFGMGASIGQYQQSLTGSSSVADLADFMQLLHLKFTPPRVDQEAFDTLIARYLPYYKNRLDTPNGVFSEAIRVAQYSNNPRSVKMDDTIISRQRLTPSIEFYQQRFANAGNFNYAFVGNIDLQQMEQLLSTYVASLPNNTTAETWQKLADLRTKGQLKVKVKKGVEPKATVVLNYYGNSEWSFSQSAEFNSLRSILSTVLRERIREEKSGVYGVRVNGGFSRYDNSHSISISFTCDPNRVDELIKETQRVIGEFKTTQQDTKYLTNMKQQQAKSTETQIKQNAFWRGYLLASLSETEEFQTIEQKMALVNNMTEQKLQNAAQHFLNEQDTLIAILTPEDKASTKGKGTNE